MPFKNYKGDEFAVVTTPERDDLLTAFGKQTLTDRYLLPGETFQDMFARVAAYYADDQAHAQRLYDAMSKLWFMPATPVLSNGGTDRGLPISCFLNAVPDSMDGIDGVYSENVKLASHGGGIGTYWGGVRELGAVIRDRGKSSGVIPFIKVMDSLTLAVSQGSLRRGSAAVYLDITHPEIEEFLDIRRAQGGDANRRCLNIHHGVNITDAFMNAVLAGDKYDLISPKDGSVIRQADAREIWQKLLLSRLETGEPYMVFVDTVNRLASDVYKAAGLRVRQSNLCSEIMLHTGVDQLGKERTAVCCLSSLNWAKASEWYGDEQFLADFLLFLDNVLADFINRTEGKPGFENARYAAMRERSIGAGVMGFHTYLQDNGIIFESALAKAVNLKLWKWLARTASKINERVALERGACPDAQDAGLMRRWAHVFAVAPTASISIICGGVSAGIEPIPANIYTAKTLSGSFEVRNPALEKTLRRHAEIMFGEWVEDGPERQAGAAEEWLAEVWESIGKHGGSVQHLPFLTQDQKDLFKTWEEIDQRWVVSHGADRAPHVCQGQSLNIFLPPDVHKRDLHNMHMMAWKRGAKSLYYLRSRSLQRADQPTHMAGEMPQPTAPKTYTLSETPAPERVDYDECLACQ